MILEGPVVYAEFKDANWAAQVLQKIKTQLYEECAHPDGCLYSGCGPDNPGPHFSAVVVQVLLRDVTPENIRLLAKETGARRITRDYKQLYPEV